MTAAVHLPSCRARPAAGILRDARSAPRCCLTHGRGSPSGHHSHRPAAHAERVSLVSRQKQRCERRRQAPAHEKSPAGESRARCLAQGKGEEEPYDVIYLLCNTHKQSTCQSAIFTGERCIIGVVLAAEYGDISSVGVFLD